MKSQFLGVLLAAALAPLGLLTSSAPASCQSAGERVVLPLPDLPTGGYAGLTVKDSQMPHINPLRPPAGAPNIVIVLLDDVGFGAAGTFGGPVSTPTLDAVANEGLRYNTFHTTALCSPTRAALLTGRNHHVANTGNITEYATGFDGYNSIISKSTATVAQVLRENGYSTAAFGKWHNTPVWEVSAAGPFDRWPTGLGFEKFYGFMGGEAHQYFPGLFEGTTPIERPEHAEKYHLTTDLVDKAVTWMNAQKALAPEKPFFIYWAPGATHAPHHVYPEWVKPYEGKFDQGWDRLREEIFTRQKTRGVIPVDAKLTPRHESIPAWDSLTPEKKKIAARLMEVYAGFLAQTDFEVGRLVQGPAGGIDGVFNEMVFLNGLKEDPAVVLSKIDQFGGPKANNEYPVGFSWAMATPFQFTKQFAGYLGGVRNPMVVSWPNRIKDHGGLRTQFHHVIDIAPTLYEAAGIPMPLMVDGVAQRPLDGASFIYSFDNAKAPSPRTTQYFEIAGTRGLYRDGWLASTYHNKIPWRPAPGQPFEQDRWELYNLNEDYSQAVDLAAKEPEKLQTMKELFLVEAARNQVLPLDDRGPARVVGARPSIIGDRTTFSFRAGSTRMPEDIVRTTFNRSYSIVADIDVPAKGADGVIVAAGGYFAGLSLYVQNGHPKFTYNYFGSKYTTLEGKQALAPGKTLLRYEFAYDGGGLGKGGEAKLYANDALVAEGRIDATVPLGFSADETLDVGMDTGTPAADTYEGAFSYAGKIRTVTFNLK
jgi:arylsulfatase A-like enzyme